MAVIIQSTMPVIKFCRYTKPVGLQTYQTFSVKSIDDIGKNLLSYSFQRSVNNFSGEFTVVVKESGNEAFFDKIKPFDVVQIQEDINDNVDFIGVVLNVNVTSSVNQKQVTIKGKGIEYLFEFMTISLDVTSMKWAGQLKSTENSNIQFKTLINDGKSAEQIKKSIYAIYDSFKNTAKQMNKISNSELFDIFENILGTDFIESNSTTNSKFKYPITNNLYQNSIITLYNYFRNLFPEKIYEFYGLLQNGKPKIRLREVPFWGDALKDGLRKAQKIDASHLLNFNVTKSIDEVYTVFYSYLEGSYFSPEFYNKLYATNDGNYNAEVNESKLAKYGYKPFQANFVGFNIDEANNDTIINSLSQEFSKLNKNIKSGFENLDEMLSGTISVVKVVNSKPIEAGDFLKAFDGYFYVSGVDHSWNYNRVAQIVYHVERGGKYNSEGKFSPLPNISRQLEEFKI